MMRRPTLLAAMALIVAAPACVRASATPGIRSVTITIHYSQFSLSDLTVAPGETVRFVLENTDPIDHEFILGDQYVQDIHENGTEAHHP
ncbi:MAG: Cupredoxin-like domain, partial [Actinomycetota bacterium]|nr:Cupredoxin-like domain [Actinomycetota bacterium]